MADGFQLARLIPVSGISTSTEAEMRATSALLSVLTVVRDFSIVMLSPLGASTARKATVEAFIETKFKLSDGAIVRPDGLVQVTYGASVWKAFVEVKTGHNVLEANQLNAYLNLAREQGVDAVVTISNEIGVGGGHPCNGVRVRSNSKVRLAHFSWTEVLAHAVRVKVHRGVDDVEQAWILGELIRYLKHPASGALEFDDMGAHWTAVRDAVRAAGIRKTAPELGDIVQRWDQLVRFAALRLGSNTGVDVQPVVPRSHSDPKVRFSHLADVLTADGLLDAAIRIPGSAGDIGIVADLRAQQLSASATIMAPTDRGSRARVTWLVRQLGPETPVGVLVESWPRHARQPLCVSVAQVHDDRDLLLDPSQREILRFRLLQRVQMGQNRKNGGRSPGFIQSVTQLIESFYETVLQQIVPWAPRPPRTRSTTGPGNDLVDEPIQDADDLDEAIVAARVSAGEKRDDAVRSETKAGLPSSEVGPSQGDDLVEAPIVLAGLANVEPIPS